MDRGLKNPCRGKDDKQIEENYNQFFFGVPRLVGIKRFLDSCNTNKNLNTKDLEGFASYIAEFKNNLFRKSSWFRYYCLFRCIKFIKI